MKKKPSKHTVAENKITELKSMFSSKSVFLIASGPSVNDFPFSKYNDALFVSMNGSIYKIIEEKIKPILYLCDDPSFPENRMDAIRLAVNNAEVVAFSNEVLNVILRLEPSLIENGNVYLIDKVNRADGVKVLSDRKFSWSVRNDKDFVSKFSIFSSKKCSIGFSYNLEKGYFGARTIPYVALQVAHYMGVNKAFLVGVDLNQEQGRFYERGEKALPSSLSNHYARNILPSFKLLAKNVIQQGRFEVYNLSPTSRLPNDVIPKINYEELMEMYFAK